MKYAVAERNVLTLTKDHPFIVSLHYAFQSKDKLFLVLDYCPGGDMGSLRLMKPNYSRRSNGSLKMFQGST